MTLLEEHPLTRDELQVETQSTSHQVDAVIAKLETAGEVDVSGSLVVRKQTRYHDDGTALSEEIEFADGHQDATVMPKAFAGVGSVPGQQIVQPLTLECGDGPGFDWQLGIHDADSWLRWYGSIDLTAGAYPRNGHKAKMLRVTNTTGRAIEKVRVSLWSMEDSSRSFEAVWWENRDQAIDLGPGLSKHVLLILSVELSVSFGGGPRDFVDEKGPLIGYRRGDLSFGARAWAADASSTEHHFLVHAPPTTGHERKYAWGPSITEET